ncbi:MAG: prepilin peptidase [Mycobacterium sp.]|nr:prepilin peptidase [Mycobacterium sp.]
MMAGYAALLVWALTLSAVDIRERRLPNRLTLTGAVVIVAGAAAYGRGVGALVGGAALAGLYLLVHLLNPAGMGAGDVKLALGLGAFTGACGPEVWALATFGAPVLTAIVGAASVARGRSGITPHGPSMCVASLAAAAVAMP